MLLSLPCCAGQVTCHLIDLPVYPFNSDLALYNSSKASVLGMCFPCVFTLSWPTLSSHDGAKAFLVGWVRWASPLHRCQTESLAPQAMLLFKLTEHFSRKEQLLPALVLLLSWPLLCADSRADSIHGCSHAEQGEQEELSRTAGLCLLLLWPWFNHCRAML